MKKNNKGFSLVELIVVVLILGILAVAVSPQIMNWIDKSKEGKDEAYAGGVATAVESVALEYLARTGSLTNCVYKLDPDEANKVVADGGTELNATKSDADGTVLMKDLAVEIKEVVANIQNPEQKNKSYYEIDLKYDATAGTVKVKVTAK